MPFDGKTYDRAQDKQRLGTQLERVEKLMADAQWRTLEEIRERAGGSAAAISARLRDLRKPKFGAYVVERERVAGGLYRYRVLPPKPTQQEQLPFDVPEEPRKRPSLYDPD